MIASRIFLLAFVIASFYFSCNKSDLEPVDPPLPMEPTDSSFTYLALGDSYTIGQGVAASERWPNQLKDSLAELGIAISQLEIIAMTGWTTRNLINDIEVTNPEKFDLVSLLIGVNNQFQNLPFSQFEEELLELLETARQLSNDRDKLFVVSIPDYGVTPFGSNNQEEIAEEIDEYNAYTAQVCDSLNIPYINITEISRMLGDSENALASDNLHPSGFQYSRWVEKIVPVVRAILTE